MGTMLPDVVLHDAGGNEVRLRRLASKPALIVVGLAFQPAFLQLLEEVRALRQQFGESDLQIVAVTPMTRSERALGLAAGVGAWRALPFPLLALDDTETDLPAWAASVPMTLLADKTGMVRQAFPGFRPRSELEPHARALVAAPAVK